MCGFAIYLARHKMAERTNWSGMTRAAQNRVRWRGIVDGLCSTGSDGHKK